jgi:hypothetical protein
LADAGPNVITRAEIREDMESAYDVIMHRSPQWLMPGGSVRSDNGRPECPMVYVDGIRYGSCESLKSIQAVEVRQLRFLNANDATTLFGSGHGNGAILVTIRRR